MKICWLFEICMVLVLFLQALAAASLPESGVCEFCYVLKITWCCVLTSSFAELFKIKEFKASSIIFFCLWLCISPPVYKDILSHQMGLPSIGRGFLADWILHSSKYSHAKLGQIVGSLRSIKSVQTGRRYLWFGEVLTARRVVVRELVQGWMGRLGTRRGGVLGEGAPPTPHHHFHFWAVLNMFRNPFVLVLLFTPYFLRPFCSLDFRIKLSLRFIKTGNFFCK